MTTTQLFSVLGGRWRVIVGAMLIAASLALLASLLMPKKYSATASVLIDTRGIDAQGNPAERQQAPNQTLIATQTDLIKSERVARHVVEALKLQSNEEFHRTWENETDGVGDDKSYIAQILLRKLDIQPNKDSNVLTITYTGLDPKLTAAIVNAFAQSYVESNLDLKVEPARQYAGWFEERTLALRTKLDAAQAKLIAYQRDHGLIATSGAGGSAQTDIETAKLSQLTAQLLEVQATRVETNARQDQAKRNASTSPDVAISPVISEMRGKVSDAEANLKQLRTQYGDRFPQVVAAKSQLNALKEQLAAESQSVARSVLVNDVVSQKREAELRNATKSQRERVLALSRASNELMVYQKDVENAQKALDDSSQRQSQAALESQLQQTNVAVLAPASEPPLPSSPRIKVNLAAGLVLGFLVGLGIALLLEFRSPIIRSADDLALMLDLPILGTVSGARLTSKRVFPQLSFNRAAT